METALSVQELARYLAWCLETGQDMAVSEEAIDRFATPETIAPVAGRAASVRVAEPVAPTIAPAEAARMAAEDLARSTPTLEALKEAISQFEALSRPGGATRLVFGEGNPAARILVLGERPSEEDERAGRPFAGPAGQLLDRMLKSVGLQRDAVYLTNLLPWRTPGGRANAADLAACQPFALRQIELVAPDLILCLGTGPARALVEADEAILKARGVWRSLANGGRSIGVLTTFSPDYLLRQRAHKKLAWGDLRSLAAAAAKLPPRA